MEAKQTPLIDLLKSVPIDARLGIDHDEFSSSFHPIGKHCHKAAAELRRLHEVNQGLIEVLKIIADAADSQHSVKARAALAKA